MSDVREDLGYTPAPAAPVAPAKPVPPPPPPPLTSKQRSTLTAVAKGRALSRRMDNLFALDELKRLRYIAIDTKGTPSITEAGTAALEREAAK